MGQVVEVAVWEMAQGTEWLGASGPLGHSFSEVSHTRGPDWGKYEALTRQVPGWHKELLRDRQWRYVDVEKAWTSRPDALQEDKALPAARPSRDLEVRVQDLRYEHQILGPGSRPLFHQQRHMVVP